MTNFPFDDDYEPSAPLGKEVLQAEALAICRTFKSRDQSGGLVVTNVPTGYELTKKDLQILVRHLDDETKELLWLFMADSYFREARDQDYYHACARFNSFADLLGEDETKLICKENEAFDFRKRSEVVLPPSIAVRLREILRDHMEHDPTKPVGDLLQLINAVALQPVEVELPVSQVDRLRAILHDNAECDPTVPVEDVLQLIKAFRLEESLCNDAASINNNPAMKSLLSIEGKISISREWLQQVVDRHPQSSVVDTGPA